MIKDSIFIPIAACEERFIEQTVRSALSNADHPENIYFGIFNNILKKEHSLLDNEFLTNNDQIFYVELITPAPMGTGFARMNASLLQFKDFEYMFQIDAHTFFSKQWDTTLIDVFNKIKDENNIEDDKLVLSASTGFFWTYHDGDPSKVYATVHENKKIFEIDPLNLESNAKDLIDKGMTTVHFVYDGKQGDLFVKTNLGFPIVYGNKYIKEKEYEESNAIHATFMFSKANLNREFMHDPADHFNGDQTNYSIRLLSRGYRIFSPRYPTIAVLNKVAVNKESGEGLGEYLDKEHNWKTFNSSQIGSSYVTRANDNSILNFKQIISGEYFGYWGTPNRDALEKVKKIINYPVSDE